MGWLYRYVNRPFTLRNGRQLPVSAARMTGAAFSASWSSYTGRVITTPDGDIVEHAIAASAGKYTATASLNSGTRLLQLTAFAPAP
ncbi:MAG: hypothetical protein HYR72_04685 [Deltaproteobacteria bacterium]|nr:hypothetical protein [Deltaproteobacteria bacterium]MBI3389818.1 hypothetical protein [Deltaproteobacteria bacterium]